jgi:hypothetical protein
MKTTSTQIGAVVSNQREIAWRSPRLAGLLVAALAVVLVARASPVFSQQPAVAQAPQNTSIPDVECVIGLETFKPNTKGTLSLLPTGLEFATGKNKADITTASIQDIFTGEESRQDVSGTAGTVAKLAIPYGGGRIVSLFSHGVELLTVDYVDSNGGFHGTIFVLPPGKATELRNQLIAQGANVTTHVEPPEPKEQKP